MLRAPGRHLGPGDKRRVQLILRERAKNEDLDVGQRVAELPSLGGSRDAKPVGAPRDGSTRGLHRPVPVAVGLDHRAQRGLAAEL